MLLLLKLALRNLVRNRRRTVITLVAVAGGLALMNTTNNFAFGMYQDMIEVGVGTLAGDVVVQGDGYNEKREKEIVVPQAAAVAAELQAMFPDATVTSRVFLEGLVTSPTGSAGVALSGVQPEVEAPVSMWRDKVTEGAWLDDDDRGILLGGAVADSLGVDLGDKVVLMTQGKDEVVSRMFRVKGLVRTGSDDIDGAVALCTLAAAQQLLEQPDAASQVAVHLADSGQALTSARQAAAALSGRGLEIMDWKQAMPEMVESIELDAGSNNVMMFAIGIIVAMGVLNTVLMSVLERIHEFGVMRAVGLKDHQIRRLVLTEGLLLGLVAVVLGDALGALLSWPFMVWGIDMANFAGEQMSFGGVSISTDVYARMDWDRFISYSAVAVAMTVLASLYPAFKASSLKPVDALRHV